jgi:hypothetical protein
MKYWNKGKRYKTSWHKVRGPAELKVDNIKRWCQLNGSKDRFSYDGPTVSPSIFPSYPSMIRIHPGIWYFENSEDAVAFKLVWATGVSHDYPR